MNNQMTIKSLAQNPLIAYSIRLPEPEVLVLSRYEEISFPAIFGNLTGISMSSIVPKFRMGRILSFDISPRVLPDPVIIFSPIGNLAPYYASWAEAMLGERSWRSKMIKRFDEAIKIFINSSYGLAPHEITFAVIEMLKFKNDVILRS